MSSTNAKDEPVAKEDEEKEVTPEKEQEKDEKSLHDRMAKIAQKAAGGASTGMGLAGLGAKIAAKVNETKASGDGKISVQQVAKDL